MLASEVIKKIEDIIKENGDIPVKMYKEEIGEFDIVNITDVEFSTYKEPHICID